MKILVVTNFYPPYTIGGYELGCADVVNALRARGHRVCVLTSSGQGSGVRVQGLGIQNGTNNLALQRREHRERRELEIDLGWDFRAPATSWRLVRKELRNRRAFARAVAAFQPDLVYIWSLRYCSAALAMQAQYAGIPTCFYVSDDWLATWDRRDRWAQLPYDLRRRAGKRLLNAFVETIGGRSGGRLLLCHMQCTSGYIERVTQAAGKTVDTRVMHWGVDPARFPVRVERPGPPKRLLYVGQLIEHKGVHTAIEACAMLVAAGYDVTLTIAGAAQDANYLAQLHALAGSLGERVQFTGGLPRIQIAALYAEHDILLFPSIWAEPFSIGLLEALAAGLAVVATVTGGTGEILIDGENALCFAPASATACAAAVARLIADPALYEQLRQQGRLTVNTQFQLTQMIDAIEQHLQQVYDDER